MPLTNFTEGVITHRVALAADLSAAESLLLRGFLPAEALYPVNDRKIVASGTV